MKINRTPHFRYAKVKKARHDFNRLDFLLGWTRQQSITVEVMFTYDTIYTLPAPDQLDWNKGPGMYSSWHPHISSAMLGWRWNDTMQRFEVGPYVHMADRSAHHLGGSYTLSCRPGEIFNYQIIAFDTYWMYHWSTGATSIFPKENTLNRIYKRSGWWFGGNQKAPKNLSLKYRIR